MGADAGRHRRRVLPRHPGADPDDLREPAVRRVPGRQGEIAAAVRRGHRTDLYNASVIAEIVRAGILSLPKGQTEAAKAIGMRKSQIMRDHPVAAGGDRDAARAHLADGGLVKDSALGYLIGYIEVVRSGQQLGSFYGNYLPALLVVAAIMIVLNSALTLLATYAEKRLRRRKRSHAAPAPTAAPVTSVPGIDLIGNNPGKFNRGASPDPNFDGPKD